MEAAAVAAVPFTMPDCFVRGIKMCSGIMDENVFLINGVDAFVQITELCGFNEVMFWLRCLARWSIWFEFDI